MTEERAEEEDEGLRRWQPEEDEAPSGRPKVNDLGESLGKRRGQLCSLKEKGDKKSKEKSVFLFCSIIQPCL